MNAGRELDKLVAEKVMGQTDVCIDGACLVPVHFVPAYYSTDIRAAWEVFERMKSLGYGPEIWGMVTHFRVRLYVPSQGMFVEENYEDAPLAICRAALKAVGA